MNIRPTLILPAAESAPPLLRAADGRLSAYAADDLRGQCVDLVIPGQLVRIYPHDLPKMREREKQAAARFTIEDRIGASLDAQHIVIGIDTDKRLAVIDAETIRGLISKFESKDIKIGDIYADFDWLAAQDNPIKLSDRIVFSGAQGYTIDLDWADDDLAEIPSSTWDDLTPNKAPLSLRQGVFARRSGINLPTASLAKIAAVLIAVGMSWLTLEWAQSSAMTKQADDFKTQTAALYTQATGKAAPANPALAVTRAVKNKPVSSSDFIPLLSAINTALSQTNGIEIQTLSFDEKKPQLNLRLIYPRFESTGELEDAAQATGNVFRPGGVREQNGILIGDATFEMGGPS